MQRFSRWLGVHWCRYITASSLANSKPMPPAIDILIACASGAVALYGLVFWLFLAIFLFLPPGGNALGPIGASLGTISSAGKPP